MAAPDKCQLLLDSIATPQLMKFRFSKLQGHIIKKGTERHCTTGPVSHVQSYVLPPGMVIVPRARNHGLDINNIDNIMDSDERIQVT